MRYSQLFLLTLGSVMALLVAAHGSLANDTFLWLGNTPLTVSAANGLLANEPAGATIADSDRTTTGGNEVDVNNDGSFTYTPAFGFTGADTFTYTISGAALPAMATIQVDAIAWYVDNTEDDGGNGSQASPFNSLAAAEAASAAGDTIFVFTGDGTAAGQDAGFDFKDNQRLIGQGVAFSFGALPGVNVEIMPADIAPVITDVLNGVGIMRLANNNEVAGVTIDGTASVNSAGFSGDPVAGFNLHDLTITNTQQAGVDLNNVSGNGLVQNSTISNNIQGDGVSLIANGAGANYTLSGNTLSRLAGSGFRILYDGTALGGIVEARNNTMSSLGLVGGNARGVDLRTQGIAGLSATLANNQMDMSGRANLAGVAIQANNTSFATVMVTANTISNAITTGGIDLRANDSGTMRASLVGNTLTGNLVFGADMQAGAITNLGATGFPNMCLRMAGNNIDTGVRLRNLRAVDDFQIEAANSAQLEAANPGVSNFTYSPALANFIFAPAGCGAP